MTPRPGIVAFARSEGQNIYTEQTDSTSEPHLVARLRRQHIVLLVERKSSRPKVARLPVRLQMR